MTATSKRDSSLSAKCPCRDAILLVLQLQPRPPLLLPQRNAGGMMMTDAGVGIRRIPLVSRVVDIDAGYLGTKRGVEFQIVTAARDTIWSKRVWQTGVGLWEHSIPFYARRLARAERKAQKVVRDIQGF